MDSLDTMRVTSTWMMNNHTDLNRPRVLLAHYDADIVQQLECASACCGKYEFRTATSGQEVIDLINRYYFDAAVIGSRFPDITGTGMAELVKSKFPYIKGVFLSSHNHGLFKYRAELLEFEIWNKSRSLNNLQELCEAVYKMASDTPVENSVQISPKLVKIPEVLSKLSQGIF